MKIHYNSSAIIANNALSNSDKKLSVSIEKLSSGYKINHSKDNPASMAISRKMKAQIRGLGTASDSANDGISVVETAEGALAEIQDMIQRMNELAIKGANGTMMEEDRETIQAEVAQLQNEIARIAEQTEFNGNSLLDGTFDLKGYTSNENVKVFSYSDEVMTGDYYIEKIEAVFDADGNLTDATTVTVGTVNTGLAGNEDKTPREFPPAADLKTTVDGDIITLSGSGDFEIQIQLTDRTQTTLTVQDIYLDITGMGAMHMQIGANEGQELPIRIPTVSLKTLGLDELDFTTDAGCQSAIDSASGAISRISSIRSRLGAYQNRLEHTVASLDVTEENMTAAYSRIMDTDMAEEMTEYTKYQVLTQAGTSMLSQANERPAQVLQLLQ
ncbi:MAG: flagellin FliC3 [Clostridiales bacterium]|nr:flagellin FliC3 [Clostridiales bacterium]